MMCLCRWASLVCSASGSDGHQGLSESFRRGGSAETGEIPTFPDVKQNKWLFSWSSQPCRRHTGSVAERGRTEALRGEHRSLWSAHKVLTCNFTSTRLYVFLFFVVVTHFKF